MRINDAIISDSSNISMSEVWNALSEKENDDKSRYALVLSIVMFALMPAFLELIDAFAGKWDRNRGGIGDGNLMKQLLMLCTIGSFTILGAATWRLTRFMREDAKGRTIFYRGLSFFCIEAALFSMLVLRYQHHFDNGDDALVKLTCKAWMMSGLVAAAGSVLNIIQGAKHEKKEKESWSSSSNYNKRHKRLLCFLSGVLCVLCYALQFRFFGIACHAYFRYDEPWMAVVAILAYTTLAVVALHVCGSLLDGREAICIPGALALPVITLLLFHTLHLLDRHNRAIANMLNSGVSILLMCHVSYVYAFG